MSVKEKILLAIYREYAKGNTDMRNSVRHDGLKVDAKQFNQEIQALQREGFIQGAVLVKDRCNNYLNQVILNRVAITHYGLYYLRRNLSAESRD